MTVWLCDRCGKQIHHNSFSVGKYEISKSCIEKPEPNEYGYYYDAPRTYVRKLKFCSDCSMQIEKLIDDELNLNFPSSVAVTLTKEQ